MNMGVPSKSLRVNIEDALAIVSREARIPSDRLSGCIDTEGVVYVVDSARRRDPWDYAVSTLEGERRVAIDEIAGRLEMGRPICEELIGELPPDRIFEVIAGRINPHDLDGWVSSYGRELVRDLGANHPSLFWDLDDTVPGTRTIRPSADVHAVPSFSVIKDLQSRIVPTFLASPVDFLAGRIAGTMMESDNGMSDECDILLDQCDVDLGALASDLLDAMGGLEGYCDTVTVTSDGFVIVTG
jgi:hypothetical protein